VAKLHQGERHHNDSETKKRFAELNLLAAGGSPADMRKLVADETRRWTDVIRKAGISRSNFDRRLRNNIGRELVLDMGNAIAQVELALLEALHLSRSDPSVPCKAEIAGVRSRCSCWQPRPVASRNSRSSSLVIATADRGQPTSSAWGPSGKFIRFAPVCQAGSSPGHANGDCCIAHSNERRNSFRFGVDFQG